MLSTSLMAVVTQALLRKANGPGRVAAHEIMLVNPAIRNLIRENKLHQIPSIMQTSKGDGMTTMEETLRTLAYRREITQKQAILHSNNPNLFDSDEGRSKRPR
jgi:twitching motility protein PilT